MRPRCLFWPDEGSYKQDNMMRALTLLKEDTNTRALLEEETTIRALLEEDAMTTALL